jgi:hypothetical protein
MRQLLRNQVTRALLKASRQEAKLERLALEQYLMELRHQTVPPRLTVLLTLISLRLQTAKVSLLRSLMQRL